MNLGDIYSAVLVRLGKDLQGNTLSPVNLNTILPLVNIAFFKIRYGLPEEYQPGHPFPRMEWEITQKIKDDLRNSTVMMGENGSSGPLVIDSNGVAIIPDNYIHHSSIWWNEYKKLSCGKTERRPRPVEVLSDNEWPSRLGDPNVKKRPSKKYPVCKYENGYIQFEPRDLGSVDFKYLSFPASPYFDYDIINSEPVYLPPGQTHINSSVSPAGSLSISVEFIWPQDCVVELTNMIYLVASEGIQAIFNYQSGIATKASGS